MIEVIRKELKNKIDKTKIDESGIKFVTFSSKDIQKLGEKIHAVDEKKKKDKKVTERIEELEEKQEKSIEKQENKQETNDKIEKPKKYMTKEQLLLERIENFDFEGFKKDYIDYYREIVNKIDDIMVIFRGKTFEYLKYYEEFSRERKKYERSHRKLIKDRREIGPLQFAFVLEKLDELEFVVNYRQTLELAVKIVQFMNKN